MGGGNAVGGGARSGAGALERGGGRGVIDGLIWLIGDRGEVFVGF